MTQRSLDLSTTAPKAPAPPPDANTIRTMQAAIDDLARERDLAISRAQKAEGRLRAIGGFIGRWLAGPDPEAQARELRWLAAELRACLHDHQAHPD